MGNRRLTVLSPQDEFVSSLVLPHRINVAGAVLLGSRFWTNFDQLGSDSVPAALQIMDRDGSIVRTFSPEYKLAGTGRPQFGRTMRSLSGSRDGLWSAPMFFEYRLEQWDTAGRRMKRYLRRPEWFPPYDTFGLGILSSLPVPLSWPLEKTRKVDCGPLCWLQIRSGPRAWVIPSLGRAGKHTIRPRTLRRLSIATWESSHLRGDSWYPVGLTVCSPTSFRIR